MSSVPKFGSPSIKLTLAVTVSWFCALLSVKALAESGVAVAVVGFEVCASLDFATTWFVLLFPPVLAST